MSKNGYLWVEDWDSFGDRICYWKKIPPEECASSGSNQLVLYGLQDQYLTQNPQTKFVKVVYDRKTHKRTSTPQ